MASSSVSFRISRSAEDLASTIHAISQRLVLLEQRLGALELQLTNLDRPEPQEITRLDNVDRLLNDCRALLELETDPAPLGLPNNGSQPTSAEGLEMAEEQNLLTELEEDQEEELLAA